MLSWPATLFQVGAEMRMSFWTMCCCLCDSHGVQIKWTLFLAYPRVGGRALLFMEHLLRTPPSGSDQVMCVCLSISYLAVPSAKRAGRSDIPTLKTNAA